MQTVKSEEELINEVAEKLENSDKNDPLYESLSRLFKDYKKLHKQLYRIIKLSDKNQKISKELNVKLDEKNKILSGVSKKLSKYLSPQIYNSIFMGQKEVKLTASRKKLTIFFSDIANFTNITANIESEDLTKVLNKYLDEMSSIALKHGATIDKFIGDAIMIFFGDPDSKGEKEDALSCISMALDMRKRINELGKYWSDSGVNEPFKIRMGIATGYCTVGNFGSEDRMDYTIIGSFVNLASRLENKAEMNEILIANETHALIKDDVFCEKKDIVFVKGIPYPIHTYKVVDFFENLVNKDEINETIDGFSIYIDNEYIKENREMLVHKLNGVIKKIQSEF